MSDEVLKSFLVAIGYKTDTASMKRAQETVAALTKSVVAAGAAVTAAAAAVEVGVARMARELTDLYYAARLAGSSAEELQDLESGFEHIGLSAGEATGLVKGLGVALRFDPGTKGLLQSFGIQTNDATQALHQIVGLAKAAGPVMAGIYADMFHIPRETMARLIDDYDKVDAAGRRYDALRAAAGINQKQLDEQSAAFSAHMKDLSQNLTIVGERIEMALLPYAERLLTWAEDATEWFSNADAATGGLLGKMVGLSGALAAGGAALLAVAQAIKFVRGAMLLLNAALLANPIFLVIAAIAALGFAIYELYQDYQNFQKGAAHLIPWEKWKPQIDAVLAALDAIGKAVWSMWLAIQPALRQVMVALGGIVDAFVELWKAAEPILSALVEAQLAVAGAVVELGGAIWKWIGPTVINMLKEGLGELADILGIVGDAISLVADILTGKWSKAWEKAQDIAKHVLSMITHAVNALTSAWPDWMRETLGLPPIGNEMDTAAAEAVPPPDTQDHAEAVHDHIASYDRRTSGSGGGGGSAGGSAGGGSGSRSTGGGGPGAGGSDSSGFFGQVKGWFGGLFGAAKSGKDEAAAPGGAAGSGARSGYRRGGGGAQSLPDIPADAELGALSRHFESRGDAGAIGWDSTGGESYGQYQIASKTGTMKAFLSYLAKTHPEMSKTLEGAGGAAAAEAGTAQFKEAFKGMAKQDPGGFAGAQHDFIKSTHYDPLVRKLQGEGLDVTKRSKAVQDVIWSTAVAHGGGTNVVEKALARMGKNGLSAGSVSDEDLIKSIYAERKTRYGNSTARVQEAVQNRYNSEQVMALRELANGNGAAGTQVAANARPPGSAQINPGAAASALAPAAQNSAAVAQASAQPLGQQPGSPAAAGPVTITQTNTTHVQVHADDARAAGKAVADQQVQVNQQLTRNLQGAAV